MRSRSFKLETGDVDALTRGSLIKANVAAMGPADQNALVVAAYVVALSVVLELKDIELVGIAVEQAGDRISPNQRRAFAVLNFVRHWVFLPSLLMTVPILVMFRGGECFRP